MFYRDKKQFRTFGRAKGKPLSPAQKALMDDAFPKVDFGAAIPAGENPIADIAGPIWLEIGFGGAEHLLWQAEQNPDVTLLGVEPFLNGVVKAVSGITQNDLKNIGLEYRTGAGSIWPPKNGSDHGRAR